MSTERLFDAYADQQTEYLARMTGGDRTAIMEFVKQEAQRRYTPSKITIVRTVSPGILSWKLLISLHS